MVLYGFFRILERQEKIAESFMRKTLRDVEKLQGSIQNMTGRSIDLKQYDDRRVAEKYGR